MKYILLVLISMSCSSTFPDSKIVVDRFNKEHEYDIDREPDRDSTVLYCQSHYKWETIRFYYTNKGLTYWIRSNK